MSSTTTSASQRSLTLLSLDGGGNRGLALLYQLKHIMCRLPNLHPSEKLYPHKYFDLIGGTSTGGLIALMFGRLGMDIDSAIKKYQEFSTTFGGDPFWKVLASGVQFDAGPLEEVLKQWFDGQYLLDPLADTDPRCRCFVTTVPHALCTVAEPIILRSYPIPPRSPPTSPQGHRWLVWEAARATSATKKYFPPLDLGGGHVFKDAGMFGTDNPALLVLGEAAKIPDFSGRPVGCLVSLGTGLRTLTHLAAAPLQNVPVSNDLLQRAYQRIRNEATTAAGAYSRFQELRDDLVIVAKNTEKTHREVVEQFRERSRRGGNQTLYIRLNPFGSLGGNNLLDFTCGDDVDLLTKEYLRHPDVEDIIEDCVILLGGLTGSARPEPPTMPVLPTRPSPPDIQFRPIYHTGFEVDPFTCNESELRQLYRDLLPREPLIGYRAFVGNGAFTLEFEGLNPVRWRSFLNAYLQGPVRVEAAVDLTKCTTIRSPSGAGVLLILPDETLGNVCYDLFFLVQHSILRPVLHVLRLSRPADEENDWTSLHAEPLPHCAGQQIVRIEVTVLEDVITVSTNSVPSDWILRVPASGGPEGLRAFGLCGIGPKKITWSSFQVSVAQTPPTPPSPPRPVVDHPNIPPDLPAVSAIPLQPILFTKIPTSLDAVMDKLYSFLDTFPSLSPNTVSSRNVFSDHVLPFLKSRFPPHPENPNPSIPIPSDLLVNWKKATTELMDVLLPEQLFPVIDLWRVALLDERVSIWATEDGANVIHHIFLKVDSIGTNGNPPRNLLLTSLQLAANCFASDLLGRKCCSSDSSSRAVLSPRAVLTSILVLALHHASMDGSVRNASATLAFNEAVLVQKLSPDRRDKDWEVEMVIALVEALDMEKESEGVVHRLTAALSLFLYLSPFQEMLMSLMETFQVKQMLHRKLLPDGCGTTGVVQASVRTLIEEVADVMIRPPLPADV